MRNLRVEFSPDALEQIRAVFDWWVVNRPSSPELFRDELAATLQLIRSSPHVGLAYQFSSIPGLRRTLMARTRYHLYFTFHEAQSLVFVHAIWHTSRGHGPLL